MLLCGFLRRAQLPDERMSPTALTALTILIAESNPTDKNKMISLVMALIAKPKKKNK